MKITNEMVIRLMEGLVGDHRLHGLSGRIRVIESEGKATGNAFESFAFPTQTKTNIIRDIQLLRPLKECYDEARKALVIRISPDGTGNAIDNNPEKRSEFTKEHDKLLKDTYEVKGLLLLNWTDLDVAKVPSDTIQKLGFLVRGLPAQDDADLVPEPPAPAPTPMPAQAVPAVTP